MWMWNDRMTDLEIFALLSKTDRVK